MIVRGLTLLLLVFLTCGFQVSSLRWDTRTYHVLRLRYVPDGMPAAMYDAAVRAAQMWDAPPLRLVVLPADLLSPEEAQGHIGVDPSPTAGLMQTQHFMQGGRLTRCAILVHPGITAWHTGEDAPPADLNDAQTALAHEMGHCLGLLHEDHAMPPALMRSKVPTGTYQRALSPDDRRGYEALYGDNVPHYGGCGRRI